MCASTCQAVRSDTRPNGTRHESGRYSESPRTCRPLSMLEELSIDDLVHLRPSARLGVDVSAEQVDLRAQIPDGERARSGVLGHEVAREPAQRAELEDQRASRRRARDGRLDGERAVDAAVRDTSRGVERGRRRSARSTASGSSPPRYSSGYRPVATTSAGSSASMSPRSPA